jgi:thiamine transporter
MNEVKTYFKAKTLAEIVIFSALAAVLYVFRPFSLPYGGSVTLGSMVPVVWLSLRRGAYTGVIAGAIFGILALLVDIVLVGAAFIIATPLQAILEYPVAFAVLGLAGIFRKESVSYAIAGLGIVVFAKFLVHYLVGVFIWYSVYSFPSEWGQYLWPAVYNGSFLLVEFIISTILIAALVKTGTLKYAL